MNKVWEKRRAKQRQNIAMDWCKRNPEKPYKFRTSNGFDVTMTMSFNPRDLVEEDDVWDEDIDG